MFIALIRYVVFPVKSVDPPNLKAYMLAGIQKPVAKRSFFLFY